LGTWQTSRERIWEHFENLMRYMLGNTLGTRETKIKSFSSLPFKKKNIRPSMKACLAFHRLHGTSLSKIVHHHFWHGLIGRNLLGDIVCYSKPNTFGLQSNIYQFLVCCVNLPIHVIGLCTSFMSLCWLGN
jgi:hypothetical protein